jgi:hypothetical protein
MPFKSVNPASGELVRTFEEISERRRNVGCLGRRGEPSRRMEGSRSVRKAPLIVHLPLIVYLGAETYV